MGHYLKPGIGKPGSLRASYSYLTIPCAYHGYTMGTSCVLRVEDFMKGELLLDWMATYHLCWAEDWEHVAVGGQHLRQHYCQDLSYKLMNLHRIAPGSWSSQESGQGRSVPGRAWWRSDGRAPSISCYKWFPITMTANEAVTIWTIYNLQSK